MESLTPVFLVLVLIFEVFGYLLYIHKSLINEVHPNPVAWIMFAYGALVMALLDWDRDASLLVLSQPVICALFNLVIVLIIWHKGKLELPSDRADKIALTSDFLITAVYIYLKIGLLNNFLNSQEVDMSVLVLLILSNVSLLICYIPLIRNVHQNPGHENYLPWLFWLCSYVVLLAGTFYQYGTLNEFFMYPVISILIHISILVLSVRDEELYDRALLRLKIKKAYKA